jgi:hypothetical protein
MCKQQVGPEQVKNGLTTRNMGCQSARFRLGVQSVMEDKPLDYDEDSWEFEKGRLFAMAYRSSGQRIPKVPSRAAIALYRRYHISGDIPS